MSHSDSPVDAHKEANYGAHKSPVAFLDQIVIIGCTANLSEEDSIGWNTDSFSPKVVVIDLRHALFFALTLIKYRGVHGLFIVVLC